MVPFSYRQLLRQVPAQTIRLAWAAGEFERSIRRFGKLRPTEGELEVTWEARRLMPRKWHLLLRALKRV